MSGKRERIPDWEKIIQINAEFTESNYKPSKKNATKQVLLTDDIKACSSEAFLEELKKCIKTYLEIMDRLENSK